MTTPQGPAPVPVQYVVTYEKPKVNHVLHAILTLLTFGLWLFVWLLVVLANASAQPTEQKVATIYSSDPRLIPSRPPAPRPAAKPTTPATPTKSSTPPKPEADLSTLWRVVFTGLVVAAVGVLVFAVYAIAMT